MPCRSGGVIPKWSGKITLTTQWPSLTSILMNPYGMNLNAPLKGLSTHQPWAVMESTDVCTVSCNSGTPQVLCRVTGVMRTRSSYQGQRWSNTALNCFFYLYGPWGRGWRRRRRMTWRLQGAFLAFTYLPTFFGWGQWCMWTRIISAFNTEDFLSLRKQEHRVFFKLPDTRFIWPKYN